MVVVAVAAAILAAARADVRIVQWASDVRPAIESSVCVVLVAREGERLFQPSIGGSCRRPAGNDPIVAALATLTAERGLLLRRLVPPADAFGELAPTPENSPVAERLYRTRVTSSPRVLERLMPLVAEVLAARGSRCADCPGPLAFPTPRRVSYSELAPYLAAYVWFERWTREGRAQFHVCSGINGLGELPRPDPQLAEAAFELVFSAEGLVRIATGVAARAQSDACRSADAAGPQEGAACVRARIKEELPTAPGFREALRPGFARLREIGLACSDCAP